MHLLSPRRSSTCWEFISDQQSHHNASVRTRETKEVNKYVYKLILGSDQCYDERESRERRGVAHSGKVDKESPSEGWHLRGGLKEMKNWVIGKAGGKLLQEEETGSARPQR